MLKRPSNKPRAEIEQLAKRAIEMAGGGDLARVWYRFTCGSCGHRCKAPEPNVLPTVGTCEVCGASTPILGGGYMLEVRRSRFVDWSKPVERTLFVRQPYESDKGDA